MDDPLFSSEAKQIEYVRQVALSVLRHLPRKRVELEDLCQDGWLGMMWARSKFNPSKGTKFRTLAQYYVRGAMIDGLRRMSGRKMKWRTLVSLDDASILVDRSASPYTIAERRELIRIAFGYLRLKERTVIESYFLDPQEPNMKTIGKRLGLSEMRIWQIISRGCDRIRSSRITWRYRQPR